MGTLQEPTKRPYHLIEFIQLTYIYDLAKNLATQKGISIDQSLKIIEIEMYRLRTNSMILDGQIYDEKMKEIGEILNSFVDKVDFIANQIEEIKQKI